MTQLEERRLEQALALLAQEGFRLNPETPLLWEKHHALIGEWQKVVSLTSESEVSKLWDHTFDSLSLGSYVQRFGGNGWLDVGSGGGFPALPVAVLLREVPLTLVERSEKKCGFLRKACSAMGVKARIEVGEFDRVAPRLESPGVVTARAVELPEALLRQMGNELKTGTVVLDQRPKLPDWAESMFHVEHVEDAWTEAGLRRGALRMLIRR